MSTHHHPSSPQDAIRLNIIEALRVVFYEDSVDEHPVMQSISLFFWVHLDRWLHQISVQQAPFVIALTGASGSGKSFIRESLVEMLSEVSPVTAFTQDNYYRDFEADFTHLPLDRFYDEIDFDDPAHIRFKKLGIDLETIRAARYGQRVTIPKLRFGTPDAKPTILENAIELPVSPFIVTEGIHAFHDPAILPLYDLKIYVDIDDAERRERWLSRNKRENRGTTDNMWNTTVECLHEYILPTRQVADLVLNNNVPQERMEAFMDRMFNAVADAVMSALSETQRQREIA